MALHLSVSMFRNAMESRDSRGATMETSGMAGTAVEDS